ncbi:MAG: hypothetical protein Q4B67_10160, partial [Eubacteriales bacterium]|nr:hypothetical protein [Eubacteriales bacterium]
MRKKDILTSMLSIVLIPVLVLSLWGPLAGSGRNEPKNPISSTAAYMSAESLKGSGSQNSNGEGYISALEEATEE